MRYVIALLMLASSVAFAGDSDTDRSVDPSRTVQNKVDPSKVIENKVDPSRDVNCKNNPDQFIGCEIYNGPPHRVSAVRHFHGGSHR